MASNVLLKRKLGGTQAAPTGANLEGDIAIYFPGSAGDPDKPTIYLNDGGGWRTANPDAPVPTIGTPSLPGGTQGSATGIGAAWTALTPKPTDPIVIAQFAGGTYLLRAGQPGGADADWVALGSVTQFATAGEIHTGTDTLKAINSKGLRDETLNAPSAPSGAATSADEGKLVRLDSGGAIDNGFIILPYATAAEIAAGSATDKVISPAILRGEALATPSTGTAAAADANKLIRLDANGQIDFKFFPALPSEVRGSVNPIAPLVQPSTPYKSGDIVFVNTGGNIDPSWTGVAGQTVESGDSLIFDGTNWHHIPNATDLNDYVPLDGATMHDGASLTFDITTGGAGTVVINGGGGNIDNAVIDCGTY
jgi:hypothetical protein